MGPTDGPAIGQDTWRFYQYEQRSLPISILQSRRRQTRLSVCEKCASERTRAGYHTRSLLRSGHASIEKGCDALFLDLHGAMVTEGLTTVSELLRRFREAAPDLPIAVALDYHTNLSATIVDNATVICGYRTYPHRHVRDRPSGRAHLIAH